MSRRDRDRWEPRYAGRAAELAASPPSAFLRAHASAIRGRVLDVAAGAGRNALFLARRGCRVYAIDVARSGLAAAHRVARAEGLDLHCVQADLEEFPLPEARFDAIIDVRYLQCSLFPAIRRALRPGGLVLVETFLADPAATEQPRNPAFLLQPGELAAAFAGFEILELEEGRVEDGANPAWLGRILARRPSGA